MSDTVGDRVTNTFWGSETVWADTKHYTASLMYITAGKVARVLHQPGHQGSYLINRGRVRCKWDDNDGTGPRITIMCTGEHLLVTAGKNISFEALEGACIIKIAT